jgi:hypothetical protein
VFSVSQQELLEMKTKQIHSKRQLRRIFWRHRRTHDPMLVLSLSLFNFAGGWYRTFSSDQYARFSA